jgi:hypothetical protein
MNELVKALVEHGAEFTLIDPTLRAAGSTGVALARDLVGEERIAAIKDVMDRAREKLKNRGAKIQPPPLAIMLPLLEAAQDDSKELRDIWASLLAAAADPARSHLMRKDFVDIAKRLEPIDALLLKTMADRNIWGPEWRAKMSDAMRLTQDDVEVCAVHLEEVGVLKKGPGAQFIEQSAIVSATGKQFLACIRD